MSKHRSFIILSLLAVVGGFMIWLGRTPWLPDLQQQLSSPAERRDDERQPSQSLSDVRAGQANRSENAPVAFKTDHVILSIVADSNQRLPVRYDAVNRLLEKSLSPVELKEVVTFVVSAVPQDSVSVEKERALRNGLLNQLREHPDYAKELIPALVEQAADRRQDPGLRDYALQHLAAWVPDLNAGEGEVAISALRGALLETEATYAGTALVGLNDLSRRGLLPETFEPSMEARRIALDNNVNVLSRLTALALASELEVTDPALAALAAQWSASANSVPEGARRTARAFLKKQKLLTGY